MKVGDILRAKGNRVVTVAPHITIDALAHRLMLERIGAVPVVDDSGRVHGIVSERDLVTGLAQNGKALGEKTVDALMTTNVVTCGPDASVKEVMQLMTARRVRHIPVVDREKLVGIVSIGDIVKNRLDDMEMETNVLRDALIAAH
jgi:CBS domain-containing protein